MEKNTKPARKETKAKGSADPAWLRSLKRESDKLGIPIRDLLAQHNVGSGRVAAAKGGLMKKAGMAKGGMVKTKKK